MMETLIRILEEIDESIDWMEETRLVDDRIIDSFVVISMIAELESAFHIQIRAEEISSTNFNSVEAIWKMICRLREK